MAYETLAFMRTLTSALSRINPIPYISLEYINIVFPPRLSPFWSS